MGLLRVVKHRAMYVRDAHIEWRVGLSCIWLCREREREREREAVSAVFIIVGDNGKPISTYAVYRVVMSVYIPDVHVHARMAWHSVRQVYVCASPMIPSIAYSHSLILTAHKYVNYLLHV